MGMICPESVDLLANPNRKRVTFLARSRFEMFSASGEHLLLRPCGVQPQASVIAWTSSLALCAVNNCLESTLRQPGRNSRRSLQVLTLTPRNWLFPYQAESIAYTGK